MIAKDRIKYHAVINADVVDNSHAQIVSHVLPGSTVLDVGCASGVMGQYLNDVLKCQVSGIDGDADLLDVAKEKNCYKKIFQLELGRDKLSKHLSEKYQCIILGDILEHLNNPEHLIAELKSHLSEDGKIIVSVPNVCHGSLKLNLLLNKFNYTEEGLLDKTHIQLFSLARIKKFVSGVGMRVDVFGRVFASVYAVEQSVNVGDFPVEVVKFVEGNLESWVYQYVFVLKLSKNDSFGSVAGESDFLPSKIELGRVNRLLAKKSKLKFWHKNFWGLKKQFSRKYFQK